MDSTCAKKKEAKELKALILKTVPPPSATTTTAPATTKPSVGRPPPPPLPAIRVRNPSELEGPPLVPLGPLNLSKNNSQHQQQSDMLVVTPPASGPRSAGRPPLLVSWLKEGSLDPVLTSPHTTTAGATRVPPPVARAR